MNETETVTISKDEYNKLLLAEKRLDALYAAGVDNWEGYDEAVEDIDEE